MRPEKTNKVWTHRRHEGTAVSDLGHQTLSWGWDVKRGAGVPPADMGGGQLQVRSMECQEHPHRSVRQINGSRAQERR